MRVLQLISSAGYYGAEAVVVTLSKELNALGATSTLGVFHNLHLPNLELFEIAQQHNLPVEIVACRGRMDWRTVREIRKLVERLKIDVIHTHGYKSHLYGYIAGRESSCAMVATCHGYHSAFRDITARLRKRVYAGIESLLFRRFDRVVAVSQGLSDALRSAHVAPEKLAVIANGIDVDRFARAHPSADLLAAKAGRLAVGVVGRLTEGKGHRQFLQAGRAILAAHPETVLMIIGDGPQREELEAYARELRIEQSTIFTGRREDMPSVYAALDVVVLPSLFEGMPVVVLEALAANRAMVATRVGAIPELVADNDTGLLVEAGDASALENAIRRLIVNPELRSVLGLRGSMRVTEGFSAGRMAREYLSIYKDAGRVAVAR